MAGDMEVLKSALRPVVDISPPEPEETVELATRRAEAFLLYSIGWKQAQIAERFGVTQATISNDIRAERKNRLSRRDNVEEETERVAGVYEHVMAKAWERHEESANANINSVAGTNYLRIVLDAAEKYAMLRGLDGVKEKSREKGPTRVIVRIGGAEKTPQIDVGVEVDDAS